MGTRTPLVFPGGDAGLNPKACQMGEIGVAGSGNGAAWAETWWEESDYA